MTDCFEIKRTEELVEHLKKNGRTEPFESFDYQLQTNYAWIYELGNGQVVLVENSFRHGGFIFRDKDCFNQVIKEDKFPIENPSKNLYEGEIDRVRTINKQIDFYRDHLNKVLKFGYADVSRDTAKSYLRKIVGRKIKGLTTDVDFVALVTIFGEVIRREIKGKWIIEKWYGAFNPYFIPRIINPKNRVIYFNDSLLTTVKWKVTNVDSIFNDTEGLLTLSKVRKQRECIVLVD